MGREVIIMLCIMARSGHVGWSGTPESMWYARAFQIRSSENKPKTFEEFLERLEAGETIHAGIITVWKHIEGDQTSLDAVEEHKAHDRAFAEAITTEGGSVFY
jgi:hypothetical protein